MQGKDYVVWYDKGIIDINIYQDGFRRIGHWAFKGDAAAVELKDKLLINVADEEAKGGPRSS